MILYIDEIKLCGSIKGHILSDELGIQQMQDIGYFLPIGDSNNNFKLEIIGSFESSSDGDNWIEVECSEFSVIGPAGSLNIDEYLDLDKIAEEIKKSHGDKIHQDQIAGLADVLEYQLVDR